MNSVRHINDNMLIMLIMLMLIIMIIIIKKSLIQCKIRCILFFSNSNTNNHAEQEVNGSKQGFPLMIICLVKNIIQGQDWNS